MAENPGAWPDGTTGPKEMRIDVPGGGPYGKRMSVLVLPASAVQEVVGKVEDDLEGAQELYDLAAADDNRDGLVSHGAAMNTLSVTVSRLRSLLDPVATQPANEGENRD